jgi:murein L,D-transpeptidase YafK
MSREMYRKLLISMTLGALLAPAAGADSLAGLAGPAGMLRPVDRVIVQKSNRRMELYRDGAIVATYKISLGLQPVGQKQREGDFRTPEGRYRLARKNGWAPGGAIMVHGLPNFQKYARERYLSTDWTDGCIALSNEDMLDFWLLTGQDTPIEIRP